MAVTKLKSGNYQARLQGSDGRLLSRVFCSRNEAVDQVMEWKLEKRRKGALQRRKRAPYLSAYFETWFADLPLDRSGWRIRQRSIFKNYIMPILGNSQLAAITPAHSKRVLATASKKGISEQTQVHIYLVMRKMFGDAVEVYEHLERNPVLRKFKPSLSQKEAHFLNYEQSRKLLGHVEGRKFGLAIWTQLLLGLRVGELRALQWSDLDLVTSKAFIRRTFVRHLYQVRDYPKGKKQRLVIIPKELLGRLNSVQVRTSDYVFGPGPNQTFSSHRYRDTLKRYCAEIGLPLIGTHGLRHSTSEIYLRFGATSEDLRQLFAHSSMSVTERYMHGEGLRLSNVAKSISLKIDHEIDHAAEKNKTKAIEAPSN